MIGIIGAMEMEIRTLCDILDKPTEDAVSGSRFTRGDFCGRAVVVAQCGAGKVNAAACTQAMILTYAPTLIINVGVAGSLNGKLSICDIAVGRDAVQHDVETKDYGDPVGYRSVIGSVFYPCDAAVREAFLAAARSLGLNAVSARIATGDQFVSDPARKQAIVDLFHADACDMESGAIAHVCMKSGVKCAILRAISDSTDGMHSMEFRTFAQIAAHNSILVLKKALSGALFNI